MIDDFPPFEEFVNKGKTKHSHENNAETYRQNAQQTTRVGLVALQDSVMDYLAQVEPRAWPYEVFIEDALDSLHKAPEEFLKSYDNVKMLRNQLTSVGKKMRNPGFQHETKVELALVSEYQHKKPVQMLVREIQRRYGDCSSTLFYSMSTYVIDPRAPELPPRLKKAVNQSLFHRQYGIDGLMED
ncbi:MAG: hypothetical protein ACMXYF_05920 [Candidatus Woesearchaeota archaeon]